jgi:hypothetical protein
VLVGQEIAGAGGHCLALGVKGDVSDLRDRPEACLDAIAAQGAAAIPCHPHDPRVPLAPGDGSAWSKGNTGKVHGVEIWSFMHDWRAGVSILNRRGRVKHPLRHLKGPDSRALRLWDELLQQGPTAAFASLDAHGYRRRPKSDLTAFSYSDLFGTLRMHILVPPFSRRWFEDKQVILDALRRGQSFIANDGLAPSNGFRFEARREDGSVIPMGGSAAFEPPMRLRVRLPQRCKVRLITGGQAWFTNTVDRFDVELTGPSVIRLEAWLDGHPWIFSNPIHLLPASPQVVS